jgi:ABC-2 type transport system ATP-binding protein
MIEIENLTKNYGEVRALDGIGFLVKKGEVLGLLGPNGAGKTTTMRILTCFLNPTSGQVKVKDYDIYRHPQEIKRLMGYLPENAPLYPDMLVYDYLGYTADIRQLAKKDKDDRIGRLSAVCGIREVMHKTVGELSRGYKQRVGLAQAMMGDPEILILDEPTSGLDPNQIIEIREIIKQIGREKTVILSTHILSEAEATCDRVIIINKGKIAADSSIEHLKQSIGGETRVHLILKNARYSQVKKVLLQIDGVLGIGPDSADQKGFIDINLSCRTDDQVKIQLYETIKNQDWILLEFHPKTKSLEHIFRELTKEN